MRFIPAIILALLIIFAANLIFDSTSFQVESFDSDTNDTSYQSDS